MDYTGLYNFRQTRLDLSDEDFLTWINTVNLQSHSIPIVDLQYYLDTNNITPVLLAAISSDNQEVRILAQIVINLPSRGYASLDLCLPTVRSVVDGLLAAGLITQPQFNDIKAMGNQITITNGTSLGYGIVTQDMLTNANKTPAIQSLFQQAETLKVQIQQIWDDPTKTPPTNIKDLP